MFMFRSKRNQLTRRVLRSRKRLGSEPGSREDEARAREALLRQVVLKRLKEPQLELLAAAVEAASHSGPCVLFPRADGEHATLLCAQLWRWPDLLVTAQLRRLPSCAAASDPVYVCCNPYHLARMTDTDNNDCRPPPYERFESERLKPEDRAPSELPFLCGDRYSGSLTTSGDGGMNTVGRQGEWCRLAYWEMSSRIGRQFCVEAASVNVFGDVPRGDGLSLGTLAAQAAQPCPEQVLRTRAKIKNGVILSREPDGIWAYNISQTPIFINSPCLPFPGPYSLVVHRVAPGCCLCVRAAGPVPPIWAQPPHGPVDPNSVRISFAKGWGQGYSRREITACPCWIEVLLAPCR